MAIQPPGIGTRLGGPQQRTPSGRYRRAESEAARHAEHAKKSAMVCQISGAPGTSDQAAMLAVQIARLFLHVCSRPNIRRLTVCLIRTSGIVSIMAFRLSVKQFEKTAQPAATVALCSAKAAIEVMPC